MEEGVTAAAVRLDAAAATRRRLHTHARTHGEEGGKREREGEREKKYYRN